MPEVDPLGETTNLGAGLAKLLTGHFGTPSWSQGVTGFSFDTLTRKMNLTLTDGSVIAADMSAFSVDGVLLDQDTPPRYDPETGQMVFTLTNGTVIRTEDLRGKDGEDGRRGFDGNPGESAYQNAVAQGFGGTKEQWAALVNPPVVEIETGRSLAPDDLYTLLRANSGAGITLAIRPDAEITMPVARYPIDNIGAGALTVSANSGVTLNGVAGGKITMSRYQAAAIEKIGPDTWYAPNAQVS